MPEASTQSPKEKHESGTLGSPVEVDDSPAAERSSAQGPGSPPTWSSIPPASPGYNPEGSTALHSPFDTERTHMEKLQRSNVYVDL